MIKSPVSHPFANETLAVLTVSVQLQHLYPGFTFTDVGDVSLCCFFCENEFMQKDAVLLQKNKIYTIINNCVITGNIDIKFHILLCAMYTE